MLKRVVTYGLGTFFSKILVFFMVPIYTRVFSRADFGYYDVLITDLQMLVSLAFVDLWSGAVRFMFDTEDRRIPVKACMKLLPVLSGVYIFSVFLLSFFIELKYPLLSIAYGIVYLLFLLTNSFCRGLGQNTLYVVSGLISTFVSCSLSIVFAVFLHKGIGYLLFSQCVGYSTAVIFVEIRTSVFRNAHHARVEQEYIRTFLKYCLPLMISALAFSFLGNYNKNLVLIQLGADQSGIYGFILKFSAIAALLISIYDLAWQEQAFSDANASDKTEKYSYYLNLFSRFFGLAIPVYTIVAMIAAPFVGGAQYHGTETFIPLAVLNAFLSSLAGVIGTVIIAEKKTGIILFSTVLASSLNVFITSFTVSRYGINAASLCLCIGFFVSFLVRYLYAKKRSGIRLDFLPLMILMLEFVIIMFCTPSAGLLFQGFLILAFGGVWYLFSRPYILTILAQVRGMITIFRSHS